MNSVAPEGQVYVCAACGKRSRDIYGKQAIDRMWDVSCATHAVLCDESSLVFNSDQRVIEADVIEDKKGPTNESS